MAEGKDERSTSAFGRGVVADALEAVDPPGAAAVTRETGWRSAYLKHFRRLVEVGLVKPDDAVQVARDGLSSVHERMCWLPDGEQGDRELAAAFDTAGAPRLEETTVRGDAAPDREFTLPYKGKRLRGNDIRTQVSDWVARGVVEPGVATAVEAVLDNPDWLDLSDREFVVLGATSQMGPLRSLLRWGAKVVAVDLPRQDLWDRTFELAAAGAGTLTAPMTDGVVGADLLHDLGRVGAWLADRPAPLVLGNYVYADGATNLRLSAATDALAQHLLDRRDDLALSFLATPTDVFVVPAAAVAQANDSYDRAFLAKVRGPLRALSGGRLLKRQYAPGADISISDSIVPQQGPNYLLAKRIHRWRATAAAADGRLVSMNIAPPTRTRSVTKNRALAAAYAGAHRFGVEVFDPSTSSSLMAALMVHDLRTGGVGALPVGWPAEAAHAAHGGLWRVAYEPRSALGIAAVLGVGALRG
ncbi:hypothetical protein G9U51_07290 [Calidifontibacter sp. DB0510]|uniref:Uncharacterized protein n=2 Tax=Metallococcus carri TaxID=1656884 RepID=A0A967AZK1_9MICO|nr:hypothetical protein [Metallococcus carri]NOP38233.1 hypothetical protein [Calidifontibacter sp. DB2511S]